MTWCDCTTYGTCLPCDVFRRREYSRSGPTPPPEPPSLGGPPQGSGRDFPETFDEMEADCHA